MNSMENVKCRHRKKFFTLIAITALMFVTVGAGCSSDEEDPITGNDPQTPIMANINLFYGLYYSGLSSLEGQDFESVLDEESKFGRNFIVYLDGLIAENKYAVDMGYVDMDAVLESAEIPDIRFEKFTVEGDIATVELILEGEEDIAYSQFTPLGKNIMTLRYKNYMWLIDSIHAEDNALLKLLNESSLTAEDPDAMHARVDAEYEMN